MIFESLFHFMYSWTITSIMPTFILETSCKGHLYMDTNCNQLWHKKILHWDFCGAVFEENISLSGMGRGNMKSYCYEAQRKGIKRDCLIPNRISFIHSFTLHGRFLCRDWEKLLEGGCTFTVPYLAEQGTDVTVNTGWGSGDPERRALLREPLNQYSSSL